MSVAAYVFIECAHGKAMTVANKVEKITSVTAAHAVTGHSDVIASITAFNFKVLGDVVITKIQRIDGVKKTITNVVVE